MKKIFGFIAPILFTVLIIIACKKEETKLCPPPANTFALEYKDSLLIFNYSENSQGLTEIDLGEIGFLPGTGLRRSGKSIAVYNKIPRNKEYQYYVRTDCGEGNYSYWVGPITINTTCDGEVSNFTTQTNSDTSATIRWNGNGNAILVEIEYGSFPLTQGTGNFANSSVDSLRIKLDAIDSYQYYGRTQCADGSYSNWTGPFDFRSN